MEGTRSHLGGLATHGGDADRALHAGEAQDPRARGREYVGAQPEDEHSLFEDICQFCLSVATTATIYRGQGLGDAPECANLGASTRVCGIRHCFFFLMREQRKFPKCLFYN